MMSNRRIEISQHNSTGKRERHKDNEQEAVLSDIEKDIFAAIDSGGLCDSIHALLGNLEYAKENTHLSPEVQYRLIHILHTSAEGGVTWNGKADVIGLQERIRRASEAVGTLKRFHTDASIRSIELPLQKCIYGLTHIATFLKTQSDLLLSLLIPMQIKSTQQEVERRNVFIKVHETLFSIWDQEIAPSLALIESNPQHCHYVEYLLQKNKKK